jgi:HPt (histidine-containing phosphotransfer) domain-containing protein
MPLKTKQHEQFMVLVISDIDINHLSLKHRRQNIIVATDYDVILMRIETTQFDLILLDLSVNCSVESVPNRLPDSLPPWQAGLMTRIKDSSGINNKTPVIAIVNPANGLYGDQQYSVAFYDSLAGPLTEQRLNEVIDLWRTKVIALDYVQMILNKTKNNQRLTLTLFEKLFEELPSQIIDINDALENKQYDLAREITHKLNGSVSFCCLMDIQQSANALESCLLNNNYASTNQHFLMLQQCILNFTRHQKFILASLGKY